MATVSAHSMVEGTKTIVKSMNEILSSINIPFNPSKYIHTTLNFKYGSFAEQEPTMVPKIMYFGIGIRGCFNTDDETGVEPYKPEGDELDLYQPIPFRCVPVSEDLTEVERMQYRLRLKETYNGLDYYSYYLKPLKVLDSEVSLVQIDTISKVETPYILSSANLNPVPVKPSVSGESTIQQNEIVTQARVELDFTGQEVYEAINVIFNGDLRRARISEYGVYSGEDRQVVGHDFSGGSFNYTEAIYTQLAYKYCTGGSVVESANQSMKRTFVLGNSSILLM